ncbi:MAG: lipoate--protein ligase [Eubacteriales bacterium]|nr:lipoate--protein ligase [Eubacteriales bacterium]
MIKKATQIITKETNPYRNLALEEYLLLHVEEEECILYLWQNRHTVVIGRNQNCWKECRVSELEEDGGFLARRLSGGGAVYHDLGNLNFTFLVRKENYDVDRQLQVILEAVRKLGIRAEKTGRNDLTVEGRKFSGNAFYQTGNCCYHHGTLLLSVDTAQMSRFLNVSKEKLQSKGVSSVKSRVANLSEFCPGLTVEQMAEKLFEAFGEIYGCQAERIAESRLDAEEIAKAAARFESFEWKYGRKIPFQFSFGKRFVWGDLQFQFVVDEGVVRAAEIYSDAMDEQWIAALKKSLPGCRYTREALSEAVNRAGERAFADDVKALIRENV